MSSVKWDLYIRSNKIRQYLFVGKIPRDVVRDCVGDNLLELMSANMYENVTDLKINLISAIMKTVALHIKEVMGDE